MEFLNTIPPVTKVWGIGSLILSVVVSVGAVQPANLVFDPYLTFKQHQYWRIITGLLFFGKLDMNLLIFFFTSFQMLKNLEEKQFPTRKSNFVFIIILTSILVLIGSGLFKSLSAANSLLTAFSFIHGKLFSREQMMFMMIIPLPIQYVPFVSLIMSIVSQQSIIPNLIGLFCGHFIFYLLFILPILIKKPILKAPKFLSRLID